MQEMALSKLALSGNIWSNIDLDYFAIWIPSKDLSFQGPFVNISDMYPDFKIQDPVVKEWKHKICVTFTPYIICYEDDEHFTKRTAIVSYLNSNGVSVLCESSNPGTLIFKQHWIPTELLILALQSANISYLRISSYGTKGKLSYLQNDPIFWKILKNGHVHGENSGIHESVPNVVFDVALSVKMENIILFKRPSSVSMDKMWPMLHWLGGGFGGFVFQYENDLNVSIKLYSLLHHHLSACSKIDWKIPKNIRTLRSKENSLHGLVSRLKKFSSFGGYRIEVRITMNSDEGGFDDALNYIKSEKLLKLNSLEKYLYGVFGKIQSPIQFWKKEIEPNVYLKYLDSMLILARHLPDSLAGGGLIHGRNSEPLSSKQKEMWIDLMLSFGHTPPMFHEAKILLREDTLKFWTAEWLSKMDLKYFHASKIQKYQSMKQFISEQSPEVLIFAAINRLQKNSPSVFNAIQIESNVKENSIIKHLKYRHPPKNTSKYCAIYKKNGGCTKAFNTLEELVKYCESEMKKKNHLKWQEVYQSNLD
jgi:hypothetical protein